MDQKEIFLGSEGDAWFRRNNTGIPFEQHHSRGTQFFDNFLERMMLKGQERWKY